MTRAGVFEGTGPTPGSYIRLKLGADSSGKLVAGDAYIAFEAGRLSGLSGLLRVDVRLFLLRDSECRGRRLRRGGQQTKDSTLPRPAQPRWPLPSRP